MKQSSMPDVYALIPAAGSAARMGLGYSKALLNLAGKTVIERSVDAILSSGTARQVIILIRESDRQKFERLPFDRNRVLLAIGGETRQQSVKKGLEYLESLTADLSASFVLVHDAARCLVSSRLVRESVEAALKHGAITTAVPVVDSIKKVSADGFVARSVPREDLVSVQTPQVFRYEILRNAHKNANPTATDDSSLVERIHPVYVVPGEKTNIKITCPDDIPAALAILSGDRFTT